LEAESCGEVVESGVDLAVGGVDRVGAPRRRVGVWLTDQAGEWPEKPQPKLDQQDAKFQSDRRQAVAAALADALDEAFRAELAQVVPKLAEAVVVSRTNIPEDIPMRRRGTPAEIARVSLFLASDDSAYVTGERIMVTGGRTNL
jgi:hypothetical protein